ncbi:MAG: hypothetical protein PHC62_10870 [Candidatus Izemoplasmatales bacterium]|nr:hypothetical protein [Candidatus Izemoplasmatales bacterium]
MKLRKLVSNSIFIHMITIFGFLALWGSIASGNSMLLLFVALSFLGAICGAFIKVLDAIKEKK